VASAGSYASLHLTPDREPGQQLTTQFLQAGCPSSRPTNSVKALEATTQNKYKKLKSRLVAFYDYRPGNGAGLFSKEKVIKAGDK